MVFAKHLRLLGDEFRAKYLNSTDEQDQIVYNEDWTLIKVFRPLHMHPILVHLDYIYLSIHIDYFLH